MELKAKIGLGTVQFGVDYGISNTAGITPDTEIKAIFEIAKQNGINLLDTASAYGTSEETLGRIGTEGFDVVTKYISPDVAEVKQEFERSLKRLGVDKVYGLMAHRPLTVVNDPGIWGYMTELKDEGLIYKTGFSFNTVAEADEVLGKGYMPDIVQVPYNYFDSRFENIMVSLKESGCEVHTRSAFLQGLFFSNTEALNPFFDALVPHIKSLQENENLSGLLLKYCLEKPFIDKVVIGLNTAQQLRDNLSGLDMDAKLEDRHFTIIEELITPSNWPKK
ncbi:MAG: aldo/keto reductase [Flavobacterium sp.]